MELSQRIDLLNRVGRYIRSSEESWKLAKQNAFIENAWFIPEFIDYQVNVIADNFLSENLLKAWAEKYNLEEINPSPKITGIIMAGNIPMTGIHDLISVFISGHYQKIKTSSKDNVLIPHIVEKMIEWEPAAARYFEFSDMLRNCDAYIATGSNNSSRYFEYYFSKFPHIIRKNRTSVAVLNGKETKEELEKLADDVYLYFGMGCRNITKLFVPEGYDFLPLIESWKKYHFLFEHHKYKNNYDYQLSLLILNNKYYMTDGTVLLVENPAIFTAVSVVNYEYYSNAGDLKSILNENPNLQAVAGQGYQKFGSLQQPSLDEYADGIDTLQFLQKL